MKTLAETRYYLIQTLSPLYGSTEALSLTNIILKDLLKVSPIDYIIQQQNHLTAQQNKLIEDVIIRLLNSEPIQLICSQAIFLDETYFVTQDVLIPRPETEELVKHCINYIQERAIKIPVILDLCTGSGCIAISIKKQFPKAIVYAVDISEQALKVALINSNNILGENKINFLVSDIINENPFDAIPSADIIISNPPYVLASEKSKMSKNVLDWEPHLALFVTDEDALIFYKKIAQFGNNYLMPFGSIFLEINEQKAEELTDLYKNYCYQSIQVMKDIHGKERMMQVSKK